MFFHLQLLAIVSLNHLPGLRSDIAIFDKAVILEIVVIDVVQSRVVRHSVNRVYFSHGNVPT